MAKRLWFCGHTVFVTGSSSVAWKLRSWSKCCIVKAPCTIGSYKHSFRAAFIMCTKLVVFVSLLKNSREAWKFCWRSYIHMQLVGALLMKYLYLQSTIQQKHGFFFFECHKYAACRCTCTITKERTFHSFRLITMQASKTNFSKHLLREWAL